MNQKIHRFFGSPTDPLIQHQIKAVLRLQPHEHIVFFNGSGEEVEMTVDGVEIERRTVMAEPTRHVSLYAAILKRDHFELIVQKATEVGVKEIIPLTTEHTVKLGFKRERLEAIAREAAELSGRGSVPVIHEPMRFEDALKEGRHESQRFIFDTSRDTGNPTSTMGAAARIHLFVGPEGGWSERERERAKKNGLETVSLGPLTLRSETAAIIATYLAVHTP